MIIVQTTFQAKWGAGAAVARELRESVPGLVADAAQRYRILSDLSGPIDTVVLEVEMESLTAWDAFRLRLFSNPAFQQSGERIRGQIESAENEFFTIEAQG